MRKVNCALCSADCKSDHQRLGENKRGAECMIYNIIVILLLQRIIAGV